METGRQASGANINVTAIMAGRSLQTNSVWVCVLLYRCVCMKIAVEHIVYGNADGHNSLFLPIIPISDWMTVSLFVQWPLSSPKIQFGYGYDILP